MPKICELPIKSTEKTKLKSFLNQVIEFRAAAMLSSPMTHLKNMGFTAAFGSVPRAAGTVLAPIAQRITRGLAGDVAGNDRTFAEAFFRLKGMRESLPEALQEFGKNTKTSREILGSEAPEAIPGQVGKVVRTPFTLLQTMDNFFFNKEFSGNIHQRAFRKAIKEGKTGEAAAERAAELMQERSKFIEAWTPKEAAKIRKRLEAELGAGADTELEIQNALHDALRSGTAAELGADLAEIRELAERAVFINREGKGLDLLLNQVQELARDSSPLGLATKAVFPFFRTTVNASREFLRASPWGLAESTVDLMRMVKNGEVDTQIYDEIGRAAFGTLAGISVLGLVQSGAVDVKVFDSGDFKNKAGRDTLRALGRGTDTVRVGSHFIPLRNLGELGQLLKAGALMRDRAEDAEKNGEPIPGMLENTARSFASVLPAVMADDLFMDDLSRFLDAMNDDDTAATWAKSFGGSFLPAGLKQVVAAGEELATGEAPDQQRIGEKKLGLFGEEQKRLGATLLGAAQGFQPDPIVEKMVEVGAMKQAPSVKLQDKGGNVPLGEDEGLILGKARGMYQKALVGRVINRPGFNDLPIDRQKKLIDKMFSRASTKISDRARRLKRTGQPITTRDLLRGLLVPAE